MGKFMCNPLQAGWALRPPALPSAFFLVLNESFLFIRNSYYGEQWASLMHRELVQWVAEHNDQSHDLSHDQATPPENSPDERVIPVKRPPPTTRISNLVEIIHKR